MSIRNEEWRLDRVRRLTMEILDQAALFSAEYGAPTAETRAWASLVNEQVQEWFAYLRSQRSVKPSARSPLRPTAEQIEQARFEMEANKRKLTGEQLARKHARWRRLWVRSRAAVVAFEMQLRDAVGEERAWAERIANELHSMVVELRHSMECEHPGMPAVNDIDTMEIVTAILLVDELDEEEANGDHFGQRDETPTDPVS
jgi:hypothetical protein